LTTGSDCAQLFEWTPGGAPIARSGALLARWTIYLTPWACGRQGGLSIGPYEDAAAATAAADEMVAAHLSGKGELQD
jgi:hypothetical protein